MFPGQTRLIAGGYLNPGLNHMFFGCLPVKVCIYLSIYLFIYLSESIYLFGYFESQRIRKKTNWLKIGFPGLCFTGKMDEEIQDCKPSHHPGPSTRKTAYIFKYSINK
jgi:hypothetical protein